MITYEEAGVNIDAGNELVRRICSRNPAIGGFSGLFPFGDHYLVASTDGVGTKLKLAFSTGQHDTIGIDLVAMCVNDLITVGAKPLFFLDYYATSKLEVDVADRVIHGIQRGCEEAGCLLLGGETAEMPGFYSDHHYDLAGFAVGVVPKDALVDGSTITEGDLLVGLPSTGCHSNGYSLIHKVMEMKGHSLSDSLPGSGMTLGESLITPTAIYVKDLERLKAKATIKGIAHITGGGFLDNIPRMIPKQLAVRVNTRAWTPPPIFSWLQKETSLSSREMFRTFNMGIGLVMAVSPQDLTHLGDEVVILGEVIPKEEKGEALYLN